MPELSETWQGLALSNKPASFCCKRSDCKSARSLYNDHPCSTMLRICSSSDAFTLAALSSLQHVLVKREILTQLQLEQNVLSPEDSSPSARRVCASARRCSRSCFNHMVFHDSANSKLATARHGAAYFSAFQNLLGQTDIHFGQLLE